MFTVGSVSREDAAVSFPFLAAKVPGRRNQIKEFTHRDPDYVFWIYPNGRSHDAKRSHRDNVPRGHDAILDYGPDCGGCLRGRVASIGADQLVVVYCRSKALAAQRMAALVAENNRLFLTQPPKQRNVRIAEPDTFAGFLGLILRSLRFQVFRNFRIFSRFSVPVVD